MGRDLPGSPSPEEVKEPHEDPGRIPHFLKLPECGPEEQQTALADHPGAEPLPQAAACSVLS